MPHMRCLLVVGLCLAVTALAEGGENPEEVLRSVFGTEHGEVATSVLELEDGGLLMAGYRYDDLESDWDALVLRISPDGHQLWSRSSAREGNDYAWVVRRAGDDHFAVIGTRVAAGGDAAGYLQCIDRDGNELWSREYGGAGSEILWAADAPADGGFLLAGQTDSDGASGWDVYVVRTDRTGEEIWSRTFGGPDTDRALGIAATPDGGALVAGFQGVYPDSMDILLVRLDPGGEELWRRTLPGTAFDVAHHVLCLPDGGFLITGYSASFGPGDQDGLLLRLDADGRMLWMKTYGDATNDRVLHAARLRDGGFATIGYSERAATGSWDLVIRRVDRDGNLLWSHREGGPYPDVGKDIIEARDGSVIAVGGTRNEHPPLDDVILLRIRERRAR